MSKLFDGVTTKDLTGENGMPTHSTSGSFVVDLFFKMGGYRQGRTPLGELVGVFAAAFGENPNLAIKCLFNLRDPRGGMGERRSGRLLWHYMGLNHPELMKRLLPYMAAYSRWDDLFFLIGTSVEDEMAGFYYQALMSGDKLAGKWAVRENKRGPQEIQPGVVFNFLRRKWGLSHKQYRDLVVQNTEVIETLMCNGMWEKINFQHVPSQAMKVYRKAFGHHQQERFAEYLAAVEKGEAKINTAVLTPVEILHQYLSKYGGVDKVLEAQWKNLPNAVPDGLRFLPMCDLSGSMSGVPMEVSISLGIYLSERNTSIFKDEFVTFSRVPHFVHLTGNTLQGKIQQMRRINMAENTNLEAAFRLILDSARRANLPPEEMPTHLLIISDMQFDYCTGGFNRTASEMIRAMYTQAGYQVPNVIFWNVNTSTGVPAKMHESGTALVSGYSPNLLRNVLKGDMSPMAQVLAILNNGRYSFVDEIVR